MPRPSIRLSFAAAVLVTALFSAAGTVSAAPPAMKASPQRVGFHHEAQGGAYSKDVVIKNNSGSTQTLNTFTTSDPSTHFSVNVGTCTTPFPPGGSCTLTMYWYPPPAGTSYKEEATWEFHFTNGTTETIVPLYLSGSAYVP
jgi:hypothetical protein